MEEIQVKFEIKHLSEHYYEQKMQEFFELELGNMTLEEYG